MLADIRAAQGSAEEASQLRSAVQAIRMAEHADDLIHAGLIQRRTKRYLAALTKFSDAYCIQSRPGGSNLPERERVKRPLNTFAGHTS